MVFTTIFSFFAALDATNESIKYSAVNEDVSLGKVIAEFFKHYKRCFLISFAIREAT